MYYVPVISLNVSNTHCDGWERNVVFVELYSTQVRFACAFIVLVFVIIIQ